MRKVFSWLVNYINDTKKNEHIGYVCLFQSLCAFFWTCIIVLYEENSKTSHRFGIQMQSISTEAWVAIAMWRYGYPGVSEIPVETYGQTPKPHSLNQLESQTSCLARLNPLLVYP